MFTIRVSCEDYKKILTALLSHFGVNAADLINALHSQDSAADGPEVDILKGRPLC